MDWNKQSNYNGQQIVQVGSNYFFFEVVKTLSLHDIARLKLTAIMNGDSACSKIFFVYSIQV